MLMKECRKGETLRVAKYVAKADQRAFSILERIDVGETGGFLGQSLARVALSVSSNEGWTGSRCFVT